MARSRYCLSASLISFRNVKRFRALRLVVNGPCHHPSAQPTEPTFFLFCYFPFPETYTGIGERRKSQGSRVQCVFNNYVHEPVCEECRANTSRIAFVNELHLNFFVKMNAKFGFELSTANMQSKLTETENQGQLSDFQALTSNSVDSLPPTPNIENEERTALAHAAQQKLRSSIQACKTRAILTQEQAVEIFKIHLSNQSTAKSEVLNSTQVATAFGVSEKTVRDIWTGRTWFHELIHLDPGRTAVAAGRLRPPGRPRSDRQLMDISSSSSCAAQQEPCVKHGPEAVRCYQGPPSPSAACCARETTDRGIAGETWRRGSAQGAESSRGQAASSYFGLFPPPAPRAADALASRGPRAAHGGDYARASGGDVRPWATWTADETAPLPGSSRVDDPFHDDWGFWPARERSPAAARPGPSSGAT